MKHSAISRPEASVGMLSKRWTPSRPRILLVDDDYDLRSLNAELLVQSGYFVDTAEDGAVGWRMLQDRHYDILITDNTMPGLTGLELIKQLRSEDMTLAVILASGTVPAEELIQTPWLQIDALLPKPYSIAQLVNTVDVVLHKSNRSLGDHTKPNWQSQSHAVGLRPD